MEEGKNQKIYEAICGVMADVGVVKKDKQNEKQGFAFRGIDDVMNALNPAMVKNKVFAIPEVTEEIREERPTKSGNLLFYTRLKITYRFYTTDGSFVEAKVIGEAMDSGDKATNKAMSIAYKYACFQVFSIPTEDITDPDRDAPEPIAPEEPKPIEQKEPKNTKKNQTSKVKDKEDAKPILVDELKIKVLRDFIARKDAKEEKILERYGIKSLQEMEVKQFVKAIEILENMPDKVAENDVDLGF